MTDLPMDQPKSLQNKLADLPVWAHITSYVGIPGLLVFYLLGMIPGMPSPADKANAAVTANTNIIVTHNTLMEAQNRAVIAAMAAICFRLPENTRAPRCPQ